MNNDRPIIVIRKKAAANAHHGGAWKVAFADFMTAMMAFFLVMWILGLNQDTRKAIAAYFANPTGVLKTAPGGSNLMTIMKQDAAKKKGAAGGGRDKLLKAKRDREGLEKAMADIRKKIA